jgi:2-acylglycerol O-acyltransferase 2
MSKENLDTDTLLERIKELEKENQELKDKGKQGIYNVYYVQAADVYQNLQKLQEEFREKFSKNYESIRDKSLQGFNLQPWIEAAAKSRNIDSSVIVKLISPKKRQLMACILTVLLLPLSMLMTLGWICYAVFYDKTHIAGALLLVYMAHIHFDKTYEKGSLAASWVKRHPFWVLLSNYFPILVVKQNPDTVFDPKGVYMFGYHPHGIISVGCFVSFAADATGVSEMFPGIKIHPATLDTNFRIPFWRELLLRLGVISVSAKSLKYVLNQGPGNAAMIVPGGAAEALDARPGKHDLTLQRRRGFFRIALQHGASLVPIYSFGENDLYEQAQNSDGSVVRKLQNILLKVTGVATPFFSGAGSTGAAVPMNPIPARVPIVTVIGRYTYSF